jgi:hypothetical protein
MPPLILPSSTPRTSALTATIRSYGREYDFPLCTRHLRLGPTGTVRYYWIDSKPLRGTGDRDAAGAIRPFVDHWWAAMTAKGWDRELDQQVNLVLARCHEVFVRDKAPQAIYRDAHLREGRTRDFATALDDDERKRIGRVVASRDRAAVAAELDRTLGRSGPTDRELPAFRRPFEHWIGRGVVAFRLRGEVGLAEFVGEVAEWSARFRRKGGQPRVRLYVNMFAYEAKAAFYRCYASAWAALVPWIAGRFGLDRMSERFLRVWHNQNQPIEVPAGRTLSGLYLPTGGGRAIVAPSSSGGWAVKSYAWRPSSAEPRYVRDVFSGQVLALHPLSGFFMNDPGLMAVAGQFFACEAFDRVMAGRPGDCPEYWAFVGAVLDAAGMYRLAAEEQAAGRGVRCGSLSEEGLRALGDEGRMVHPRTSRPRSGG